MFRAATGAATAGLTIALCVFATPASAAPAASALTANTSHAPSAGGQPGAAGTTLPNPTTQECDPQPKYKPQKGTPWAQQALDYQSVWGITQGQGIKVAVIDSGVDANPQFGNRVTVGKTYASSPSGSGPAWGDCAGHGTEVAGIIAAAHMKGTAFEGVAPKADILSYKVTNSEKEGISPDTLALAIIQAVHDGAKVINMSIATYVSNTALQYAVNYALSRGVVLVASAGNSNKNGPAYPASYPGVIGVGAVDETGALEGFSDRSTHVSVTAPGGNITSTFPSPSGDAHAADNGTSFSAPFVSGLAALLFAKGMNATQVIQQIEKTADGPSGTGTGYGMINPVQAVTAVEPSGPPSTAAPQPGNATVDRPKPNPDERTVALSLAGGAAGIAVLVIAAAVTIPAGRRRRWRPGP